MKKYKDIDYDKKVVYRVVDKDDRLYDHLDSTDYRLAMEFAHDVQGRCIAEQCHGADVVYETVADYTRDFT